MNIPVFYKPLDAALSTLAIAHSVGAPSIVVQTADAAEFGNPSPSSPIRVTVLGTNGRSHYSVTGRTGNVLSWDTTLDGYTDLAFAAGDKVGVLVSAGTIADIQSSVIDTVNTLNTIELTPGPQGYQGSQGATGTQGNQGSFGAQGFQGAVGSQGATGSQGNQGSSGAQGSQGATGNQGATGSQGNQGTAGIQGIAGQNGPQGTQGSNGSQGSFGAQGFQGYQGFTGVQGSTGTPGTQGFQGYQGTQGYQGVTGTTGGTGTQGSQGPQGTQGNQGSQGVIGIVPVSQGGTGSQSSSLATLALLGTPPSDTRAYSYSSKQGSAPAWTRVDTYAVSTAGGSSIDNGVVNQVGLAIYGAKNGTANAQTQALLLAANGDFSSIFSVDASANVYGTSFNGIGTALTSLNANNISIGTVSTARLGSGAASASTYLRGDGSWATPSGGSGGSPGGSNTQLQYNNSGAFGGSSSLTTAPSNPFTVNYSSNDFINTSGANAHFLMKNPANDGQTVVESVINDKVCGKWRTDFFGNISWVCGMGGSHAFYVGDINITDASKYYVPFVINSDSSLSVGASSTYIGSDSKPIKPFTINYQNGDFTNTGGINSHLLLTNPSPGGQNVVLSQINGVTVAKWRTDYVGNISWVAGSTGSHSFYVGGDFSVGKVPFQIDNDGTVRVICSAGTGFLVQAASGQTHDLVQHQDHSGSVLSSVDKLGAFHPPQLADSAALNGSTYYSTTQSKLVYKDPSGVVNPLY